MNFTSAFINRYTFWKRQLFSIRTCYAPLSCIHMFAINFFSVVYAHSSQSDNEKSHKHIQSLYSNQQKEKKMSIEREWMRRIPKYNEKEGNETRIKRQIDNSSEKHFMFYLCYTWGKLKAAICTNVLHMLHTQRFQTNWTNKWTSVQTMESIYAMGSTFACIMQRHTGYGFFRFLYDSLKWSFWYFYVLCCNIASNSCHFIFSQSNNQNTYGFW